MFQRYLWKSSISNSRFFKSTKVYAIGKSQSSREKILTSEIVLRRRNGRGQGTCKYVMFSAFALLAGFMTDCFGTLFARSVKRLRIRQTLETITLITFIWTFSTSMVLFYAPSLTIRQSWEIFFSIYNLLPFRLRRKSVVRMNGNLESFINLPVNKFCLFIYLFFFLEKWK